MNSFDQSDRPSSHLRSSLRMITAAGCLAMVYVTGVTSPAFVEFIRSYGATEVHFGLLGAVPMIMWCFQFAGAAIANSVTRRKPLFMTMAIASRLLYIPLAFLPLIFRDMPGIKVVMTAIILTAVASAMAHLTGPLWLSWMADLIPRSILNRYWGQRQKYMYATWTLSFLAIAAFTAMHLMPIRAAFPLLAALGVAAGVTDILLFLRIPEPPNLTMRHQPVLATMLAPLRNRDYRSFVVFSCAWSAAVMFSAAFMQIYALKILRLTVWRTTLIWCCTGAGIALVSSRWGRVADRHGHRPILALCMIAKSTIVLVLMLVTPKNAFGILPAAFFFDSFWDAGIMVASNGYMLKIAPQQNRSMFIAAMTSLAGLAGGLGAMAGGFFLKAASDFEVVLAGREWGNYHLLFAVNILMRLACIALAFRIREPKSTAPAELLYTLRGTWPRFLGFPVGMYRRLNIQTSRLMAGMRKDGTLRSILAD